MRIKLYSIYLQTSCSNNVNSKLQIFDMIVKINNNNNYVVLLFCLR